MVAVAVRPERGRGLPVGTRPTPALGRVATPSTPPVDADARGTPARDCGEGIARMGYVRRRFYSTRQLVHLVLANA
eukprot:CAMPEP_0185541546 /NCGR_PEP_ID=MMETSP1381-20130426/2042_1 /TAXON_ID=298111 /ORGANISM="Pavlova sp., Strain CCMP459" /LENGTH=75 /DNA_ID=CAMNT_0028153461 /DNA_START=120 /DNA_END=343 /DNA_ORIENTATION=+